MYANTALSNRLAAPLPPARKDAVRPMGMVRRNSTQPSAKSAPASEADFIGRLQAGDDEACEMLVRKFGGPMLSVAKRYMRDEEEARDVVQEAFLQAFRAIGTFRAESRLSTWLHRITVTTALMKLRSRRRRREESIDDLLPTFSEDGHRVESCREWEEDPEEALGRQQTRAIVRNCIARLPKSYRIVLTLRDIDDVDTREAADILGISETAVKVRLHRARQALRELLDATLQRK